MIIKRIKTEGTVESTTLQFDKASEIIPIHLFRYNSSINKLIKAKEIDESDVDGELITWEDFWKARNDKIRAYLNCIQTLIQKEELLQFHNKDFLIELNTKETITIKESSPKYNFDKLTLTELIELFELMKRTKAESKNAPIGVFHAKTATLIPEATQSSSNSEKPNIELIKQETITEVFKSSLNKNPTARLQEVLMRISALKLKEAGANLDEEEEQLIK